MSNDYSFSKEKRLLKYSQFQSVRQGGIRVRDSRVIINAKNNDLNFPRLGLITSKKSLPLSVTRNKVRRRVREWFRKYQQSLPSMDFVIIMTYSSASLVSDDLTLCLNKLVEKLAKHCK